MDVMDKRELLAKENRFIDLRNKGKTLKEISQTLGIPLKFINKWELSLKKAMREMPDHSPAKVEITGKNEHGNYIYRHSLSFKTSFLEGIKFKLWQFANRNASDLGGLTPEQINYYEDVFKQARKHLDTVSKYVTEVNADHDPKTGNFALSYSPTSEDPVILTLIAEAVAFYAKHIHSSEVTSQYALFRESSEDTFHPGPLSSKVALPFAIKRICVKKYQGITDLSVGNIPVNTQWVFLTGENGYGKTTFLQAITIGLLGHKDGDRILADNSATRITMEFKNNRENTIRHLWIPFKPMANMAAYGSARLEIQNAQSQSRIDEHMAISYSLFNTDGVLQNIEFEMLKWYLKKDKKFNAVKKLFKKLIPHLHDIIVEKERDEVLYIEKDNAGATFEAIPFHKLASGFRSIIAMIGDMMIRLYKQQPEIIDPQKLSGIVLIDELDLHLHPKWQRDLPVLLSTAFPLVQFIVSTHSVIPFLGAPPNSVFLKVTRDRKKGIQVQKLDIDIKNLLPNTILTSAIFDMDNITQRNHDDLAEVRTEDTFNEVLENDQIREKLEQFEESDADFPSDLFNQA